MSPVPPVWVSRCRTVTLRGQVLVRVVGQVLADGVVQRQLAGLDELQRRHGGEHLVHRADAELGVGRVRRAALSVGKAPGVLEQDLAVAGDEHGAGELVCPGELLGAGRQRRHRLAFAHSVQDEIDRGRRLRGDRELDPTVGVGADGLEADVVDADTQRTRVVGCGQAEPYRLARPAGHVETDLGRLEAVRIAGRRVEHVDQHVAVGHRVDRRRRIDEVDPELLVGLGPVVGEGLRAAERGAAFVEDRHVNGEAAVQREVPVKDPSSPDRSCPSPRRACPGAGRGDRTGRWDRSAPDRGPSDRRRTRTSRPIRQSRPASR